MINSWDKDEAIAECPNCIGDGTSCKIHINKEGFRCSKCKESGSIEKLFNYFAEEYFNLDYLESIDEYSYTDCKREDLDVEVGKYKTPEGKRFYTYNPIMLKRPMLFALPLVKDAVKEGTPIVWVDGEKDAQNLIYDFVFATTSMEGSYNYDLITLAILDLPKGAQIILCGKADLRSQGYITAVGRELIANAVDFSILENLNMQC